MNLENYYYYFQSAVPPKICDEIVKYGLEQQDQLARTGKFESDEDLNEEQLKDLSKKRKSNVVWMNDNWIYKEIHPYIHQANASAGWNFDWDFQSLVNSQNIKRVSFMIGIAIRSTNHMIYQTNQTDMAK